MRATKQQAASNERNLTITFKSYGHFKISCEYYGKVISTTTTNTTAIDDFNSCEYTEADRVKDGYESLCNEIIRNN